MKRRGESTQGNVGTVRKDTIQSNMNTAYQRVCANKGAGGADDVTVEELGDYIKENWESIREQIRRRKYKHIKYVILSHIAKYVSILSYPYKERSEYMPADEQGIK